MERKVWAVAIAAALAGTALLRLYMHRFEQEATGGPAVRTLVLVRDALAGTKLSRDMLGERDLPRAYVESRHVRARDLPQVVGGKLAVSARAGDALLWTDLAALRDGARSLASLVPEGMRAVIVAPAQAASIDLLAPGDRVDVLSAPVRAGGGHGEAVLVAENLLVLAVGGDLGGVAAGARSEARHGRTVALATTPELSLRLAAAQRDGALHLVLRNPDDVRAYGTAPAKSAQGSNEER